MNSRSQFSQPSVYLAYFVVIELWKLPLYNVYDSTFVLDDTTATLFIKWKLLYSFYIPIYYSEWMS